MDGSSHISPYAPFAVTADGLSLSRGGTPLFAGLSLRIAPGELLWVHGGNGLGKTSLLRVLAGFSRLDAGAVTWESNGQPVKAQALCAFQGHQDAFKPSLTACEALRFWAEIYGVDEDINGKLEAVGLLPRADVAFGQLSAGQKRRLSIARMMMCAKPLWIMDEPTAAMDARGVDLIHSAVSGHIARGGSAVIASHDRTQSITTNARRLTLSVADADLAL